MQQRIKWTDRTFDFSFPAGLYPEMIERLRGTPARLDDHLATLPPGVLVWLICYSSRQSTTTTI